MAEKTSPTTPADPVSNLRWSDVVRFVRQLSHDLRNHLNAAELQAVYLGELTQDAELTTEIKRLRETISQLGAVLQRLAGDLGKIKLNPITYRTAEFMEDIRTKLAKDFPDLAPTIQWDVESDGATLEIDAQLLQQALFELFTNAFRHGPAKDAIKVTARTEGGRFIFSLSEPKAQFDLPTENWGREPFQNITQGHYGLGLMRVRAIVEGHSGKFRAQYDPAASTLITTVDLPLASGQT